MEFKKKPIIEQFKVHHSDTGSTEVQIALLTGRINYLAEHFKKSPKDYGSRTGFLKLIGQRRSLLNYLNRYNPDKYRELIAKLELRK